MSKPPPPESPTMRPSLTFLATLPNRLPEAVECDLWALVNADHTPRYRITSGQPERNQPAYTLCIDGPRDQADPALIEAFQAFAAQAPQVGKTVTYFDDFKEWTAVVDKVEGRLLIVRTVGNNGEFSDQHELAFRDVMRVV